VNKQYKSFFNPFNPYKGLIHVPEWKRMMKRHIIPFPIQVAIDMSSKCQLNCVWCNSKKITKSKASLTVDDIKEISQLAELGFIRAGCIGGGGESLCNPNFGVLVNNIHNLVKLGLVTNGIYICLLYTSPSPRDATLSRMPSSA